MKAAAGTDLPVETNAMGVRPGVIPGGRCAVLRYPGNTNNLEPAALYLYRDWLPANASTTTPSVSSCGRILGSAAPGR